ncbi:23S rRNA (pseudouridine(1915)-N(3))-methyltransferase RlmH [Marimonas arenosa]|uniref:Ribosomal RNA large subunit methyltransferase H n=1 Tax=Marimonas arenosa TaxID=1795305 RepID=A0AAE3WCP1_9RHOB|nr:23S rRNA (pseudouridine(1915)-N(3))-methyltransferase RlmH [Marimonas arenosa]MDQ2090015.1 23S rRNA (pseudouridine(1915)-N(3))-methyltransferase RlmH [Marimonas arenosa]
MRVTICAVGRLRAGPEKVLIDDYAARFDRTGRSLGLGPLTLIDVEDRKGGGMTGEAVLLQKAVPQSARVIALDERGKLMSSPDFAATLARFRDDGTSDLAFLIGGADGLDPGLRAGADLSLSLGQMVWPHMLARVMLCEQLYRAAAILAGTPYHRA